MTKSELKTAWMAARATANDAADASRTVYAKSKGPKDPAAIAAKSAAEVAIAARDAAKKAFDSAPSEV